MGSDHINYGSSKAREESFDEQIVINPIPRAVIRPNTLVILDGEWQFDIDNEDVGIEHHWHLGHEYNSVASWPGTIETHVEQARGLNNGRSWQDKIVVWYEREFPMPLLAANETRNQNLLLLTFGACGYETRVWLNGVPLHTTEGEEIHLGGYTSFSYELEDKILLSQNRLTVRIEDTMNADVTRGKQESYVYKRGGIWYQTYTGGVRSIWLESVERNRLRSRVDVVSNVEDNLVRINLTTRIKDPGSYTIRLNVYHRKQPGDKPITTDSFQLSLEAGQKSQRLVIEIPDAVLWSPDNPHLYRLVAELIDKDGYVAQIETRFGLRKIEARGQHIYLNNNPVYLDGILYQPGNANYQEIRRHMYATKKLGCNLVRIHIAGVDPRIYNLADKLGLLLWVEVPSPHSSNEKSRKNHQAELLRMLALIGTHPSVVIWSLYNEDWGAQDIATSPETQRYIIDLYHFMQLAFPQFLVVDNDGWQHISYLGRLKSDLLTVHLYTADLENWTKRLDELQNGDMVGIAAFPLTVGDPFFFRKQLPIIISEWGGFGFVDYGGPTSQDDRAIQIALFKKELKRHAIAGDVYTQATNIEEEKNGIIDFATGALKVPEGLLRSSNTDQQI